MPTGKRQAITYHDNGAIETTFEANHMSFCLLFSLIYYLMLIL